MHKIVAIAWVTVRGAIRSRVVLTLTGVLVAVVIGFPLMVRGDGTLAGHVQILIGFTLRAVGFILGLAAVGSGCGAFALEIQNRQIQLLVTKPVRPIEIWLGKALGLILLQGVLLGCCGAGLYGMLRWTAQAERWEAAEWAGLHDRILVSRAVAVPFVLDAPGQAREIYEREVVTDPMLAQADRMDAMRAILRQIEAQSFSIGPGAERTWPVRLPFLSDTECPLMLQFRFAKSIPDIETVSGVWRIRAPGSSVSHEQRGEWRPQVLNRIWIPADVVQGGKDLEISFFNQDPVAGLLFDPHRGVEVQMQRGTFEMNLLRALGGMFFRLILLTAVGLAAGTLFSLPVAGLCSFCLVLLLQLGDYVTGMAAQHRYFGEGSSQDSAATVAADRSLRLMYRTLDTVIRPLRGLDAVEAVASGRRISWGQTGSAFAIQVLLYGGILAWLSAAGLRRRELGAIV